MPDPLTPYLNLLRPFSPLVWATVIVSLLLTMSFYSAYAAREAQESGLAHRLWYSLRDVFGSFLGQGKIFVEFWLPRFKKGILLKVHSSSN